MLTRRETEIVELLAKGYNNKHIAEKLFISEQTVKTHIAHVATKWELYNQIGINIRVVMALMYHRKRKMNEI